MVRRYTTITVPQPLNLIPVPGPEPVWLGPEMVTKRNTEEYAYLLTSRLPGVPLFRVNDMLSDRDTREFVTVMHDFITQLRAIPRTDGGKHAICNTLGEACRDHRILHADPMGPFVDEEAFSQFVANSDGPARRGHKIVFTHADLTCEISSLIASPEKMGPGAGKLSASWTGRTAASIQSTGTAQRPSLRASDITSAGRSSFTIFFGRLAINAKNSRLTKGVGERGMLYKHESAVSFSPNPHCDLADLFLSGF